VGSRDKNELKTTSENCEFGHNAPSATSRFSLAGSSLNSHNISIQVKQKADVVNINNIFPTG
jgi:hypothetical protein